MLQNNLNRPQCPIRWKVSWAESRAFGLVLVAALASSPTVLGAAQAPADPEKAAPAPTSSVPSSPAPELVIVGHGPDRPNQNVNPATASYPIIVVAPVFVPYFIILPTLAVGECAAPTPPAPSNVAAAPGPFGRFMNDPMARFLAGSGRLQPAAGPPEGVHYQDTAPTVVGCLPIAPRVPRHRGR